MWLNKENNMKCLRCEGSGIDPQAQCWDDSNYNRCLESDYGETDFWTWLRQAKDMIIWKVFG